MLPPPGGIASTNILYTHFISTKKIELRLIHYPSCLKHIQVEAEEECWCWSAEIPSTCPASPQPSPNPAAQPSPASQQTLQIGAKQSKAARTLHWQAGPGWRGREAELWTHWGYVRTSSGRSILPGINNVVTMYPCTYFAHFYLFTIIFSDIWKF